MDSPYLKQTVCKVLKIFQYGKYLVAYLLKLLKYGATDLRDKGDVRFYLSARAL